VGILLQNIDHDRPLVPLADQLGDPAFSDGDDSELGTGKEAVDDNEDADDKQFYENGIQLSSRCKIAWHARRFGSLFSPETRVTTNQSVTYHFHR